MTFSARCLAVLSLESYEASCSGRWNLDVSMMVQGGFGSTFNTSTISCALACQSANGCNAFSYNPFLQQCFLKANPSQSICPVSTGSCGPAFILSSCNSRLHAVCGQFALTCSLAIPYNDLEPRKRIPLSWVPFDISSKPIYDRVTTHAPFPFLPPGRTCTSGD